MDRKMNTKKPLYAAMLLIASLIWGVAFVAQTKGMDYVGPFTFSTVRACIAGLTLIPCFLLFDRMGLSPKTARSENWKAGITLGVIIFVAANLQQVGMLYTSVAKAGFITSLYIVFVPIAGLLLKRRAHPMIWICALIAVSGLYLLSVTEDLTVSKGDLMELGCALVFTLHILAIDYFAARADVVRMSCIQFFVFSALSAIPMAVLEQPSWQGLGAAWPTLLYAGMFSGGVAYTLQMFGQRNIEPAAASLLLSPEAVFAALAGWVLLGQTLSARELTGCALVLSAVLLSQMPWDRLHSRKSCQIL